MAIENLGEIEKALGLEEGKFNEMATSEDNHSIDISELYIAKKADNDALINNVKKESGNAAVEIAIKNARKDLGLEFEGKNMENLLKFYKEKVEADSKIAPEKKYSDLHKDFEALQRVSQTWEEKYSTLEGDYRKKEQDRTINNSLLKSIPDNTSIPKEDVLAILKSKLGFNIGEDGLEIIKDNKVLKNDSTLNNLSVDEFMTGFITPYLKAVEGGAGGDDSKNGSNPSSLDIFDKQMEAKGIGVGSEAYNEAMSLAIKNGTLKF